MWIKIEADPDKGLVEQYIKRANGMTVASLRKEIDGWTATLLNYGGISSWTACYDATLTTTEAKTQVKTDLRAKGWIW